MKYNTSVEKEETTYTRNGYREVSVSFCIGNEPKSGLARDLGDCLQSRNVPFGTSGDYIGKKERMRIKNYRDIRERVWIC